MKTNCSKVSFDKISEEKRKRIFESAIAEFSEQGYSNANINRIANRAGVSVGSMYKYFNNKEDLYLTIIHYGVETLKKVLEEIVHSENDLLTRIEKIIKAIQLHSRTKAQLTKLYNEMTTESHSDIVWKIVSDMEGITANLYASFIEEAKKSGKVHNDVNARLFAFFLDNLFILLQFSYSCEYYKERFKMFAGEDIFDKDDFVAKQLIKFIKGAIFVK